MSFKKAIDGYGGYSTYYYSDDLNLWVWKNGSTYYMSASVGIPLSVDGSGVYLPSGFLYNGYDYRVYGSLYLWRSGSTYYITSYLGFGNISTLTYWTSSSLTGTYTKQGTATANITVAALPVTGYSSSSLFGEYTEIGGSGKRYLGVRSYAYGTGVYYIETSSSYNSKPTFQGDRKLWWQSSSSKWIISDTVGTADASIGYWEKSGATPIEGSYSRVYTGDSAPNPSSYTLSAPTYAEGTNRETIYMAQVGVWLQ